MARPVDYELLDKVDRAAREKSYPKSCPFVEAVKRRQPHMSDRDGRFIGAARAILREHTPFEGSLWGCNARGHVVVSTRTGDTVRKSIDTGDALSGEFDAR